MKNPVIVLFLFYVLSAGFYVKGQSKSIILKNATVIDGTGEEPREGTDILIMDGRVVAVESNIKLKGAKEINLAGKTVIPSLISAHAHVGTLKGTTSSADNYTRENVLRHLQRYQDYGVNAVLAMGTDRPLIFDGLRDSTVAGLLPGARLFSAGYGFNTPDPNPGSWMNLLLRPETPEEVPAMMDRLVPLKPTVVKIWVDDHGGNAQKMKPEIYQAIIAEAHKRNIRVAAHLFYAEDARLLTEAGIDIIAHSIRDRPVDGDLLNKMKEKNVIYIPTLSLDEYQFAYANQPDWINDEFFKKSLEPGVYEMITDPAYAEKIRTSADYERNSAAFKTALVNLKMIMDAGITVALGTDSGAFPIRTQGFTEHLELELMVQAGLTPIQAIMLATQNAAKALKIDTELGTLTRGKKADLIILSANPANDIKNTRKIEAVWKDGREVSKGPL
ncbi:amidohydrolase family protein [Dyadobacter fanqingshengii]|uniref:Amidohydrolase family protein n=1 Tax=Dyadobacter fanqingshengii TaxID=2906443 RepID=A0A9X1PB80_9BACT|nr:amidohydrolase family protein [Dyadobacter fanqingshengii]MCF0041771.1 amidohydrolase family protein [Dyadobacter fanqingshengii]USJ36517.1 amidohydrolase family protein [Dyadobacter fanqingshengii]